MKLPVVSSVKVVKALVTQGFGISRQSGSHIIIVKVNHEKIIVVVPKHPTLAHGTLLSIILQSDIGRKEFCRLLK